MVELTRIRTDVVGSLLRPEYLKDAYREYERGALDEGALRAAQDRAVREAIALQEAIGLDVVTDGEYRRVMFEESLSNSIGGFREARDTLAQQEARAQIEPSSARSSMPGRPKATVERLRLVRNQPLEEYRFASQVARTPAKVTLINTDRILDRWDPEGSRAVYADAEAFLADLVRVQREIVQGLVDAGCPYVQIDGPQYTAYVDEPSREQMRARGEDPDASLARAMRADNAVIADFPGVTFGVHLCRGNRRSMWHREGSYDAIAERLFNTLAHDRFLLEYDTERAGTFAPLRFVPKGKVAVLGLVTTKGPETPTVEELRRRIDEATQYLGVEQLALSPQCGFASSLVGNLIDHDDQRRKLETIVETARRVWG
jgi:5-methyltetrahydropteroyltriglutamate--homocysteine methyltransferase